MRRYMLISIMLVCIFGYDNENLEGRTKGLENENKDLGLKIQKQSTDLESSSGVIKDVTTLIENIQETGMEIEERKYRLRSAKELESTVNIKEDINSIQVLHYDLKRHRETAAKLQRELDSLIAGNTQQYESISSLKIALEEKTIKIEELTKEVDSLKKYVTHLENKQGELTTKISYLNSELNLKVKEISRKDLEIRNLHEKLNSTPKISYLNSELNLKAKEISRKDLEIRNLHEETNTIFYVIGNSRELRRKNIIDKKGIPLLRSLNPFSKNYVLGSDFTLAEFKQENATLTELRIDGKIKKILPYRNKDHYDISYEKGFSFINIKDPENFWHQKYLVVITN